MTGPPRRPQIYAWSRTEAICRPLPASSVAGSLRGRPSIAAIDRFLDLRSAVERGKPASALDGSNFIGQVRVLDRIADPGRVVAGMEVVQPGRIVDPGRDLQEQGQVLDAKGQRAIGPAKIEAAVLPKLALAVFAGVAQALQLGLDHPN